jgi:hypothetical protein
MPDLLLYFQKIMAERGLTYKVGFTGRLPQLRGEIAQKLDEERRIECGLESDTPEFNLKLKGLNDAWYDFHIRGTVRLLKRLLDWIDTVLGSIASAVPGAEGLKELKEAIEKLIDKGEDLVLYPVT